jgi:hypothetical protein
MKYETQIKKILQITENENQNTLDIDALSKVDWLPKPENFVKQTAVISLCTGFNPQTGTTTPDGEVSPQVTIVAGVPAITPPPFILPVLLDFEPLSNPLIMPGLLATATAILLVASSSDDVVPVPETTDDATNADVTITPSDTGIAVPIQGTPTLIAPGILSIPISSAESNITGENPLYTVSVTMGGITTEVQVPLTPSQQSQAAPVDTSTVSPSNPAVNLNPSGLVVAPTNNLIQPSNFQFQFSPNVINMPLSMNVGI